MGLDQYLHARRFIWGGISGNDRDKKISDTIREIVPEIGSMTPSYITVEAIYWRKANAIHKWMVDNVQGGKDDCGDYYVDADQLHELATLCERVLTDPEKLGPELLPSGGGFFFGSTDYNEWYVKGLEHTATSIREILANEALMKDWSFEYHSSW